MGQSITRMRVAKAFSSLSVPLSLSVLRTVSISSRLLRTTRSARGRCDVGACILDGVSLELPIKVELRVRCLSFTLFGYVRATGRHLYRLTDFRRTHVETVCE